MIAVLFLFAIFAIGLAAVLSMVLKSLGLDPREAFTLFLLATGAVIVSTIILFLTSA